MLRSLKDLERYAVSATDGDVGTVENFLFDDERWCVRHLVVETGSVLQKRKVLVSPIAFGRAEWSTRTFHLALTTDKIRRSPSIDTDEPVSRQHESDYYAYYGYPFYWQYGGACGMGATPGSIVANGGGVSPERRPDEASGDVHLRSADGISMRRWIAAALGCRDRARSPRVYSPFSGADHARALSTCV